MGTVPMRNISKLECLLVIALIVAGCQEPQLLATPRPSETPGLSHPDALTPAPATEVTRTSPAETSKPTVAPDPTSTYPPGAHIKDQCLEVLPTVPLNADPKGVAILNSTVNLGGRYKREFLMLDMATNRTQTVENGGANSVSPDRSMLVYGVSVLSDHDEVIKHDLVIADARGQILKAIPWDKEWLSLLGWVDNQRLVFVQKVGLPDTLLVFNPFDGTQQLHQPDFPRIAPVTSATAFHPSWSGWFNVMYDPTLTRAVYPRLVGPSDEIMTYAIWDTSEQQLVSTLENIFAIPSDAGDIYPMPHWSPDGSHFVFLGLVQRPAQSAELELFRVSRDGIAEQLTQLSPIAAFPQDSSLTWSPDGRHIAMFLDWSKDSGYQASVAVLDITTLEIKNYCLLITYGGEGYGGIAASTPVWSPDGNQFLIVDWYSQNHRRVILVDIAQSFAAEVAQDMEPIGWMASLP